MNQPQHGAPGGRSGRSAPPGRTQALAMMTPPDDSGKKAFMISCASLILLVFIASIGCTAVNLIGGFMSKPTLAAVGAVCAILLGIPYLLIILWLDRNEKEPAYLLFTAFLWGAVISTMVSCVFNTSVGLVLGPQLTASLSAPFIEELTKGAALIAVFVFFKKEFDNVLDGVVYGAIVGLGFAVFENWLYYVQMCETVSDVLYLAFIRGVVAGVGSHACYTALTGIGLGLFRVMRRGPVRWLMPPAFLMLAMFVHFAWNTFAGLFMLSDLGDVNATMLVERVEKAGWDAKTKKAKRYKAKEAKGSYYKVSVRSDKALPGSEDLPGTVYLYTMSRESGATKVAKKFKDKEGTLVEQDGKHVLVAVVKSSDDGALHLLQAAYSPTLKEIAKGPILLPAVIIHIPFVLLVLLVTIISLWHETKMIRGYLQNESAPVLHPRELEWLVPASRRTWHVMALLLGFKFDAWSKRRKRNTLLIRLAFEKWHMDSEAKADKRLDGHHHAKRVIELRQQLSEIPMPD